MNRWLLTALFTLALSLSTAAQTASGPNEGTRITQGTGGSFDLTWWGHPGRTYFLQHSTDLKSWIYFPDVIESGNGASSSYGFTISGTDRYFLRLCYSDIPTSDPATADFDGDGIGSHDELLAGLNPLSSDTDGDGIDDSGDPFPLELATGTAPVVTVLAPLTGSTSVTSIVTVTATVTADRSLDEVRINSVLVSDSGGQYSRTLTLTEGSQNIIVSARTTEGRVTVAHHSIVVDALPPNVVIESPADDQVFSVEYARVRVLAESNTATVTANGSATTRNGYYSYAWVNLDSGANTLTVLLTEAGRQSTDSLTVTFTPPAGYDPNGDDDGDGVVNSQDKFPNAPNESDDSDNDGTGDNGDPDNANPTVKGTIKITSPADGTVIQAK